MNKSSLSGCALRRDFCAVFLSLDTKSSCAKCTPDKWLAILAIAGFLAVFFLTTQYKLCGVGYPRIVNPSQGTTPFFTTEPKVSNRHFQDGKSADFSCKSLMFSLPIFRLSVKNINQSGQKK